VHGVRTQKSTIKLLTTTAISSLIPLDLVYKPGTLFMCHISTGMPGCEEMKSPTSSRGTVLIRSLWNQSLSWGS